MDRDLKVLENCFGALNVDLIDIRDTEALEDAAYVCASQISELEPEICEKFLSILDSYIENSDAQSFVKFMIDATDVDWAFDDETEQALRTIGDKLKDGIKFYSDNRG